MAMIVFSVNYEAEMVVGGVEWWRAGLEGGTLRHVTLLLKMKRACESQLL